MSVSPNNTTFIRWASPGSDPVAHMHVYDTEQNVVGEGIPIKKDYLNVMLRTSKIFGNRSPFVFVQRDEPVIVCNKTAGLSRIDRDRNIRVIANAPICGNPERMVLMDQAEQIKSFLRACAFSAHTVQNSGEGRVIFTDRIRAGEPHKDDIISFFEGYSRRV